MLPCGITVTLFICFICFGTSKLFANNETQTGAKTNDTRDIIWSFDSNLLLFNKSLPDESTLEGAAGSFTIGYGRTRENAWILGKLHIISGPWDSAREGSFDADFSGSMVDVEYGTAFPGFNLRSGSSPILTLSAGYIDLSGKNIGGNKKTLQTYASSSAVFLEQDFKTTLSEVVLTPGIGWSWTKSARPISNEQKMLTTRVEASILKLNAIVPVHSRARVAVSKRSVNSTPDDTPKHFTSRGHARGYAFEMSLSLWLGV